MSFRSILKVALCSVTLKIALHKLHRAAEEDKKSDPRTQDAQQSRQTRVHLGI